MLEILNLTFHRKLKNNITNKKKPKKKSINTIPRKKQVLNKPNTIK